MVQVAVKRVYEEPHDNDGARVLIDKLWPRGVRKDQLVMDCLLYTSDAADE